VKSHWPKYVEGCERAGRKADPANWRVAKSIFVADDDKTAKAYATGANSPYRYYYSQLFTKMKHGGRMELFSDCSSLASTSSETVALYVVGMIRLTAVAASTVAARIRTNTPKRARNA